MKVTGSLVVVSRPESVSKGLSDTRKTGNVWDTQGTGPKRRILCLNQCREYEDLSVWRFPTGNENPILGLKSHLRVSGT